MVKHVTEEPPSLRSVSEVDIPEHLERIILRCLSKTPDDRPPSALELERELSSFDLPHWTQEDAEECWRKQKLD